MEKRRLNLDKPLLSMRRIPSKLISTAEKSNLHKQHSLPLCKPDLELGEVTKPVAVPFMWEHLPGRPKAESESLVEPSTTPRLPPGRISDASRQLFEGTYEDYPQTGVSPLNDSTKKAWERMIRRDCDLESEDGQFSDLLETPSPTQSLSIDCGSSGLSGYGPSGTFTADIQTRDYMINRFLPAAKAMVLDTPNHVPKRQPMTPEQPKIVPKIVKEPRKAVPEQQISVVLAHRGGIGNKIEKRKNEDEDEKCIDMSKKPVKRRGLFSRFSLKKYLCLPTPGTVVKAEPHVPASSVKKVNRMARTAYSGPITHVPDKHFLPKVSYRSHSQEFHKIRTRPTTESGRLSYSGDLQMMNGSSPYQCTPRGNISPYRNPRPQSPFREGARFLGVKNKVENIDNINYVSNCDDFSYATPPLEKTLYIDSLNFAKDIGDSTEDKKRKETSSAADMCLNSLEELSISNSKSQETNSTSGVQDQVKPGFGFMPSPLPPLPKSPSESWRWRGLPSMSSLQHPFSKRGKSSSSRGTKWETIVKTSNVHRDHMRYSEELVPHVSQYSKTRK